jgi:ribosomal protein S1
LLSAYQGRIVCIDGIAAFLPGSQVDVRPIRNLTVSKPGIEAKVTVES